MPARLLRALPGGEFAELRHPVTGHRVRLRPRTHTADAALRAVAEAGFSGPLVVELRDLAQQFPGAGWDRHVRLES